VPDTAWHPGTLAKVCAEEPGFVCWVGMCQGLVASWQHMSMVNCGGCSTASILPALFPGSSHTCSWDSFSSTTCLLLTSRRCSADALLPLLLRCHLNRCNGGCRLAFHQLQRF